MPPVVRPSTSVFPSTVFCLAQAAPAQPAPPLPLQLLPLVAIGVAAYLLLFRPERERVRKQQAMLGGLKKNDRVVTSSGIYGTVAAVDRATDRVTLRIDESANAKLTVTLASIGRVLREGGDSAETTES